MRISSPPTAWPCFYGIDTPTRGELIASSHTVEEIRRYLDADSLGYLSLEGLERAVRGASPGGESRERDFCRACFSGDYPVAVGDAASTKRHLAVVGAAPLEA